MECPYCSTVLSAQEDWLGCEALCPSCSKKIIIQRAASEDCGGQAVPDTKFTFVCPSCSSVAELPASLLGKEYECQVCFEKHLIEAASEKACPHCGKTVKYHATICKHCKGDMTQAPKTVEEVFYFICPDCNAVKELPLSMNGKSYECKACCEVHTATPATERKCPFCGELIKLNAKICKSCKKHVPEIGSSAATGKIIPRAERAVCSDEECNSSGFSVMQSDACLVEKLMLWFWICLGAVIVTCGLSSIGAVVIYFIMLYKFWKAVPVEKADGVTPAKAVGFLFIPFFGLYWIYVAYYKLSEKYQPFSSKPICTYAWVLLGLFWGNQVLSLVQVVAGLISPEAGGVFAIISILVSLGSLVFMCIWLHNMRKIYLAFPRR